MSFTTIILSKDDFTPLWSMVNIISYQLFKKSVDVMQYILNYTVIQWFSI